MGKQRYWAAALILALYAVPLGDVVNFWNPNEASRVMLAVSLAKYGTVRLDPTIQDYGVVPQDLSVRDGHAYSDKAPGMSLVGAAVLFPVQGILPPFPPSDAPDYWPARHLLTFLLVCIPAAWYSMTAAFDRRMAPPLTRRDGVAIGAVFALATPMLTYSSLLFSHVSAGLLIAAAYLLARSVPPINDPARFSSRAFFAGFLCSVAVLTEYPTVILAAVVSAAIAIDGTRRAALTSFVYGAIVGAIPLLVYNKAAWGSFFTTGYAFKAAPEHAAVHAQGIFGVAIPTLERLWGVLFSARRGLLFYCPALLLVGLGWLRMWKAGRRDALLSMAGAVAYLFFAASFVDWEAGWSAAARHLVPLLPWLFVPFAIGIRASLERTWMSVALGGAVGCSASAALLSVAVTPYLPEPFTNPLAHMTLRSLADGVAMRNLVTDWLGIGSLTVFAVYSLVVIVAVGAALVSLANGRDRRIVIAAAFVLSLVSHATILAIVARRTTAELELRRADLVGRLGYVDLAERIIREHGREVRP